MPRQGRPTRPGTASSPQRKAVEGILSESNVAWLETYSGKLAILMYKKGSEEREEVEGVPSLINEPGPSINLMILKRGRPVYYQLSVLTAEELQAFKEFINLAIELAEPVVAMRDKAAQDALEEGDDSLHRIYRQVPNFIVRERTIRENGEGVYDGLANLPSGNRGGGHLPGGVRVYRSEVADGQPADGGTEDDGQAPDEPA